MANIGIVAGPRGGFRPGGCKFAAMCLASALLITARHAVAEQLQQGLLRRASSEAEQLDPTETISTCQSTENGVGKPDRPDVTLSIENPTVTLVCEGRGNYLVPSDFMTVCEPNADESHSVQGSVDLCNVGGVSMGTPVSLLDFVYPEGKPRWLPPAHRSVGESRTLHLDEFDFPLFDKSFNIGCGQTPENSKSECRMKVNVRARLSAVEDNVVTCAYGEHSNPKILNVDLTPQNNSVTVTCGSRGIIQQVSAAALSRSAEQGGKEEPSRLLRGIDASWWTSTDGLTHGAKVAIPLSEFSTTNKYFYIGCAPATQKGQPGSIAYEPPEPVQTQSNTTNCIVKVTIKGVDASSLSASFRVNTAAAASGVAAVAALLSVS
ncbi:SAG-related sequence [Besnoitia besnoiti]|uniref:SAG-related sequence n=1 Tax=Besnoitia besnoiti TaxID=94643 RepID=A0A2A9MHW1_BESBE|nr:SAG-related sequence [Besnoitia besnoiti]PFH35536.1 SAG-related sequence [Besnoitia besnoiti]